MGLIIRSLLFIALLFFVEFYFYRKLFKNIRRIFRIEKIKKIFVLIPVVLLNIYPLFLLIDWGYADITNTPVYVPQNIYFDYLIIYPFWIMIFIVVQSNLFLLILDILKLPLLPFYKRIKFRLIKIESRIVLIIIAVFIIYVPARIIYDYNTIQIRKVFFVKKNLPNTLKGFKLVFISDIHADRYTDEKRLQKFINDVNLAKPDLVLIGGDMISSTPEYISVAAKYMGKIKSKYGVFSCVGDHDNWAYRRDYNRSLHEIEKALNDYNVEMVNNGNKILYVNDTTMKITFITDTYVEHISNSELIKLTSDTASYGFKILLVHQPRQNVVIRAEKENYDLLLAGHTHGGQITFIFPYVNLTPTLLETKYVRGNFKIGKMLMIVTRGLGMSLVPVRYNSTPEVTVINFNQY